MHRSFRHLRPLLLILVLAASAGCDRRLDTVVDPPVSRDGAPATAAMRLASRTLVDGNVLPAVWIVSPPASPLVTPLVKSGQIIRWQGADPDGPSGLPVSYRYRFFVDGTPENRLGVYDPDSLRRWVEPQVPTWESASVESSKTRVPDGPGGQGLVLVVVAVDDHGALTAPWSLTTNVLYMRRAAPSAALGPRLTVFTDFYYYGTPSGIGVFNPPYERVVSVAPGQAVTVSWLATPRSYVMLTGTRWALDLDDVFDETPRRNVRDLAHWSPWSLTTHSVTVGPFHGPDAYRDHVVAIEAVDELGDASVLALRLHPVSSPRTRDLLIVDDTRMRVDQRSSSGDLEPPGGPWPTAAELDTFLYARGGAPWRGYPPGTVTAARLFSGYAFDTLGTRTGAADLTVPLGTLMQYRNVVWITDAVGATASRSGIDMRQPMTALRYMTTIGRFNALAAYIVGGGRVWLVGGGAAMASSISNNDPGNDRPLVTFRSGGHPLFNELGPGRFMWELAHWRSGYSIAAASPAAITRSPLRDRRMDIDLSRFPPSLALRSPATDPVPPLRSSSDFYTATVGLEFLVDPNSIVEDRDRSAPVERLVSVLDTLYQATAVPIGAGAAPVVTYYHGSDHAPVLFSGLDLWSYRRDQSRQMVDAVLQGLWGLSPTGDPSRRANRHSLGTSGIGGSAVRNGGSGVPRDRRAQTGPTRTGAAARLPRTPSRR